MKNISLLFISLSFSAMLMAQAQAKARQQVVQQIVIKMFEALSNRDSGSLKLYCTADITLFEYGQVWNMDTLIAKAITQNAARDFQRTNTFDFIRTTVDKTMAWVTYRLQSVITRDGRQGFAHWLETVVLINEKGQWKIKHLHSTLIERR